MFTLGRHPTKYVYPSLFFLLLLLLLLIRHSAAEERRPGEGTGYVETVQERNDRARRHSEAEFLDALDNFNYRAYRQDELGLNLLRNDAIARDIERDMTVYGGGAYAPLYDRDIDRYMNRYTSNSLSRYQDRYGDLRYGQERDRLDSLRRDEQQNYRRGRQDLERRLSGYSRNDPEYNLLQQQLYHLERRYAERERDYENRFKSLDVEHAITRW